MPEVSLDIGDYSVDQDLFSATQADGRSRVRVQRPDRVQVVLGRASRPEVELNTGACQADGVEILRRRGGGCAVVLDPGNLVVAVSLRAPGIGENRRWFERINRRMIDTLAELGAPGLGEAGISDLALGDRKVAGCSLHRSRDTLYYAASLLVRPRVELMTRYLRHPPREPDYRRGRAHADFVVGLEAGFPVLSMDDLLAGLEPGLKQRLTDG